MSESGVKVQGVVRWFSDQKGYGFINFEGKDAFVHYSSIVGDGYRKLNAGDVVEFEPVKTLCAAI